MSFSICLTVTSLGVYLRTALSLGYFCLFRVARYIQMEERNLVGKPFIALYFIRLKLTYLPVLIISNQFF